MTTAAPSPATHGPAALSETGASQQQDVSAGDLLVYLAEYEVLMCREQGGVRNWSSHLRDHHSVDSKTRRALKQKYSDLKVQKPKDVRLPLPLGPPLPILGEPLNAFVCNEEECGYVSISRPVIAQHCNKTHGWHSRKDNREHWVPVKVQTFFRTGGHQRYFTVLPSAAEPAVLCRTATGHETEVAIILNEYKEAQGKREELEKADDAAAKTDRTGWFNRNGWPEHLARRNMGQLSRASRMPDHKEHVLRQPAKVVDLAIEQSVAGLSTLAQETRRWLKSASRKENEQRPLSRLQNPESQRRYAGYMKRFVYYCLRVLAACDEDAVRQSSNRSGRGDRSINLLDHETESEEGHQDPMQDAKELFP